MVRLFMLPTSLGLVLLLCSVFSLGVLAAPQRAPLSGQHVKNSVPVLIRKSSPIVMRRSEPVFIRTGMVRKSELGLERRNASGLARMSVASLEKKGVLGQHRVQATVQSNAWVASTATDSRSPCPVLNMLANHNYLPHDGRNITPAQVSSVLQTVLNVAPSLADSLMSAVQSLLSANGTFQLHDLALHGLIEHDASLVHLDANGAPYAPVTPDPTLVAQLVADSIDSKTLGLPDFAKSRVRRENASPALNAELRQFVQGEPSLLLGAFGGTAGATGSMTVKAVQQLFGEERMPDGFVRISTPLTLQMVVAGQQLVAMYMGKVKAALAHSATLSLSTATATSTVMSSSAVSSAAPTPTPTSTKAPTST